MALSLGGGLRGNCDDFTSSPMSNCIRSSPTINGPSYVGRVAGIRSSDVAVPNSRIWVYTASFGLVRENTTPRHVPAKVIAVPEIPRTKSGKIVELAVRSVVHGETVNNTEALANPEALEHYRGIAELAT